MGDRLITCVYCGLEYPDQTPTSGAKILTDHIKICEKHPLRESEEKILMLRKALSGLVGASEKEELKKMEILIRSTPAIEEDKISAINAIHALLSTIEE